MGYDKSTGYTVTRTIGFESQFNKQIDWYYTVYLIDGQATSDNDIIQAYMEREGITDKSDLPIAYVKNEHGQKDFSLRNKTMNEYRLEIAESSESGTTSEGGLFSGESTIKGILGATSDGNTGLGE